MKSLHNLSYKTLFTILFLALAGIVFFLKIGGKTTKVSAAWWDESWHYRKSISVTNSSGTNLTDFQVSISIGTSQLIADGKMQTDCDDIRVTDVNGNLLPYWIETGTCNTALTNIISKIDSLPSTGSNIYIYYGNPNAQTAIKASVVPRTCSNINAFLGTGLYYVNPTGTDASTPVQAYCDMSTDGGGWTLVASWNTAQEWTKTSTSTSAVFDTTAKNTVSSNFGNTSLYDFRVLASDTVTTTGTSAYADWYYHYNTATTWKEVWAPSANLGGSLDSTYRSTSPRQALKPFNYSYNLKFNYQVTQTWNNLSDWGIDSARTGCLANYWTALTTAGNPFGIFSLSYYSGSNGTNCGSPVSDGSLGICPSDQANCNTGQDRSTNNVKIGYDDGQAVAGFGGSGTTSVGEQPGVQATTKLWWFIRNGTPANTNYSTSLSTSEETSTAPIAYWKFDEGVGTTAYDSANNQNNGTISGATWSDESQCVSGKCLDFNGTSNFIKINQSPTFNYLKEFTISFWIKHDGTNSDNYIFYKGSGGPYAVNITGNTISFNYWNTSGTRTNGIASVTVSPNQWHQITITFKENDIAKSYIDGKLANSTVISSSIATNTTDLYFNTYNGTNNNTYNVKGVFDEVKIYPYARTADQIKQDYNSRGSLSGSSSNLGVQSSTAPDLNSSLFSHWKFNNSLYNSVSTGSTAIAPLSGTPNYTSAGKDKQGLDFTQLYTGNFTYVSSNTFEDTTKNWTTNELVGYQFATDYTPNSQYCQGTITSNTSTTITFSGSCSSWVGNKYYRIKKSIYISAPLTGHSTNAITASLWFKSNGSQGNRIARMSNEAFNFTINGNNISTGINTYGSHITYTTNNVNDQKWHYMAITYDGSTEKLFYDGVAVGLYSTATTVISNGSLTLGSRNDGMQEFFNGSIDEVKIYNKALTPDEIKQDYNGGSAIQFGSTNQTIGGTTTSLDYCIPGDTSYCAPPVAEWKMDEGVGTSIIDTSGNSNTGTISGATFNQGKIGKGLDFDGSNKYVSITNSTSLRQTGNYTLETWFKPKNNTAAFFILKNGEYGFKWNGSTSALQYYDEGYINSSKTSWNLNQWYHLSMVKIGTTASLYINGILDSSASSTTTHNTAYNLELGRFGGSYFNGSIDQVKIYNYARTPAQVAYDYNRGGPVGWWKMDECQGSTIYDWSGNGNNGTLTIGSNGTQNSIGTCQIGTSAAWTNGATGKFNSSLNFDGTDDYNSIPNNNSLNLTETGGAVSVWFKTNVNATGSVNGSLVAKTNTYTNGYWFTKYNNKLRISLYGTSNLEMVGNKIITDNLWHHAVATWTPNILSIYIDGVLDKSQGYSFTFSTASQPLYIARMLNTGEGYFSGQIDDVRVYNYALTPDQIKQIYNGGAINFN